MAQFNRWLKERGVTKGPRCYMMPCTGVATAATGEASGASVRTQAGEAPVAERRLRVTITTGARDRHGDILEPGGAQIAAFLKNPVVLWAHEYRSLPIGRVTSLVREGNAIRAEILFAPTESATEVYALYARGFLRAWSVGFLPLEWEVIEDEQGRFAGYHVRSWELIELSAVPVPANPEALSDAVRKGLVSESALVKSLQEAAGASEAEAACRKGGSGQPDAEEVPLPDLAEILAPKLLVRLRPCLGDAVAREIRRRQGRLD